MVAGLIADKVMEPALRADTWLARTFTVIALSTPAVRDVETILTDHEQLEKAPEAGEAG